MKKRIMVFIDGANLYESTKELRFDFDYKKLLTHFKEQGDLVRVYYFTALPTRSENSPIYQLIDWLSYNGYTVISKPTKEFHKPDGAVRIKGNMDVEIVVKMMQVMPSFDVAFLFSGDGDFVELVKYLQSSGKIVHVYSTLKTIPPFVADDLRRQADQYFDLDDMRDLKR